MPAPRRAGHRNADVCVTLVDAFANKGEDARAILVDGSFDKVHSSIVKRLLSLLLILGALMGLMAQEVAFASAPAMQNTVATASQMSDECAEMMGVDTSQPDQPCKGMTLDCIAKMGCAAVAAPMPPAPTVQRPSAPRGLRFAAVDVVREGAGPLPLKNPPKRLA